MTFNDWPWRYWRRVRPDAPALWLDQERLDWRTLGIRLDALAAGFRQQGVHEGDGVVLRAKNGTQTLLAWLALLQCGARILPVNPQLPQAWLDELLPEMSLAHALDLTEETGLSDLNLLTCREAVGDTAAPWQPGRLVSMTLTSGSTGLPKAAVHSAAAHLACAEGVLALMPFEPGDCWLLSLPLFHVSGQGILWRWLLAGATLAVRAMHPLHEGLRGCSHASLVPTQLWRLLNEGTKPECLREVLLGGAAIPAALTRQAEARGIRCYCGYGLTELASTVCARRADGEGDVGSALPGREVRVVDGEIQIRATSMTSGYWRNGTLQPVVDAHGWFCTRDRGVLRDGTLTVLGRLDNLFFSGGEGVQPEAVEQIIAAHPGVHQVLVVPVTDVEFGHRPVAVVECDRAMELETLRDWAAEHLARFQQPVRWLRLPETLKSGGIKISRRAVQAWVEQQPMQ
ncbi:o-succinylbenzoate--CoA ligase [Erwinia sp. CPCC 100877]|nr:o-succinylbenzoate--CoA ligase [Erwinia sp. CPCC 100877]